MGRRDRGSDLSRYGGRFSSARRRACAHQRERHADSLSPEFVERTPSESKNHRGEGEKSSRGVNLCLKFQSPCRSSANRWPRRQSFQSKLNRAKKFRPIRKSSKSKPTKP